MHIEWSTLKWILATMVCIAWAITGLQGCNDGDGGNTNDSGSNTPIDYSFMMGASYNYCGLYQPNYKAMIDKLAEHKINALRVFAWAGWNDNYKYKPCINNDITNIDPLYIQRLKDFVSYANKKGIIVIYSLFHNNSGDEYNWIIDENGDRLRVYIQAVVTATKGMGIIYECLNENVDTEFSNYITSQIHGVWAESKTCRYADNGGTYRIEHTTNKSYIGGGRIQSTDDPRLVNFNAGDAYNVAKQAKEQGGHVEYLMWWGRYGTPTSTTPEQLEINFGEDLDLLKTLR